ncbi:MAG TPA: UbiX family flavin prenyltransferase [Candidatus Thermoplasmatota archaeon]|nr:UbiX family flavin prenyltransferase [Candidatus Thermoplasmatota archaeon]
MRSVVVAMTGASGTPYGVRALETLAKMPDLRIHLILTPTAERLLAFEAKADVAKVKSLAHEVHRNDDFFAPVASGSHRFLGMLVIPASMKHVGLMASGIGLDLVSRTADVCLKERRTLVIVPRETPLSSIHLRNLLTLSDAGARIVPAMPGFYVHPETIDDMVDHVAGKALDALGVEHDLYPRWRESRGP